MYEFIKEKLYCFIRCVCCGSRWNCQQTYDKKIPVFKSDNKKIIVIDPGHGGNDPGKVGIDGSLKRT